MSPFYFISTYDDISASIISTLMHVYSDIRCPKKSSSQLLPKLMDGSIDQFIEMNTIDNKFNGNIKIFFPREFDFRKQAENSTHPFLLAHISAEPVLRIKFLLCTWLNLGLTPEIVLNQLEEQIKDDLGNQNSLLNMYQFNYFYQTITQFYTNCKSNWAVVARKH